jgi:hypothetical protein
MIMLPKNWFQPPIRRRRRVKYGLTPPLQHFRRRPHLMTTHFKYLVRCGAVKVFSVLSFS